MRIVHSCGFDSIPSDLGVFLLHEHAGPLGDTTLVVAALKGGFSGGTLASLKGQIDELRSDPNARRVVADPYALSPGHPRSDEPGLKGIKRDPEHGWLGPFVMASYNTRIVRRSHFLLDYGSDFRYREVAGYGTSRAAPVKAFAMTAGLGVLGGGLAFKPTRKLLDRVLPDPGEGPGENARRHGFFRMEIHGAGHRATVAAKGDPGYAATAVMMGESALCLALDVRSPPAPGGRADPGDRARHAARRAAARRRDDLRGRCKQSLTNRLTRRRYRRMVPPSDRNVGIRGYRDEDFLGWTASTIGGCGSRCGDGRGAGRAVGRRGGQRRRPWPRPWRQQRQGAVLRVRRHASGRGREVRATTATCPASATSCVTARRPPTTAC